MRFSSSYLFDYGDEDSDENEVSVWVDRVIDAVSDVARRLSQRSGESPTAIRRDDEDGAVAGPMPNEAQGDVEVDAVMVAMERSSVKDAVVVACARDMQKVSVNNLEGRSGESTGGWVLNEVTPGGANRVATNRCEVLRDADNNTGINSGVDPFCTNLVVAPPSVTAVTRSRSADLQPQPQEKQQRQQCTSCTQDGAED